MDGSADFTQHKIPQVNIDFQQLIREKEHSPGSVIILLKNGNRHSRINGTIMARTVEWVLAETIIAAREENSVPIYPPARIRR